jgi:hypothetical protein
VKSSHFEIQDLALHFWGYHPTTKLVLVPDARPLDVAVNVYVPARSMRHPENTVFPPVSPVVRGFEEQVRIAPPVGGVIVNVTETAVFTGFPAASVTVTEG